MNIVNNQLYSLSEGGRSYGQKKVEQVKKDH